MIRTSSDSVEENEAVKGFQALKGAVFFLP